MKIFRAIGRLTLIELLVIITIACIGLVIVASLLVYPMLGMFPFGPKSSVEVTVERLYVDYSGGKDSGESSYMVGTDKGVFEVNNSIINGIYNCDEIYSGIKVDQKYVFNIRGNKVTNILFQEYPYIIGVKPIDEN